MCGDNNHITRDCVITDPAKHYCVNCESHGHTSWDRNCDAFAAAKDRMISRNKEATFKYFPIPDDPTSWTTTSDTHDLPAAHAPIPAPPPHQGGNDPTPLAMANPMLNGAGLSVSTYKISQKEQAS
jgi:hypothetical protein